MKTQQAVKKVNKQKNHLRLIKKGVNKRVRVSYFRLLVTGALFVTLLALGYVIQYSFYNQYSMENDRLNREIASLKQGQQELESRMLSLESPIRIERIAREKLAMDKPEEVGYIVYEKPVAGSELALKQ